MTIKKQKPNFDLKHDVAPLLKQAGLKIKLMLEEYGCTYLIDRYTTMNVEWSADYSIPSCIKIEGPMAKKVSLIIDSAFPKLKIIAIENRPQDVCWIEWFLASRL